MANRPSFVDDGASGLRSTRRRRIVPQSPFKALSRRSLFVATETGFVENPSSEALSHSAKHLRYVTQSLIYNTNLAIGFETLPIARMKNTTLDTNSKLC